MCNYSINLQIFAGVYKAPPYIGNLTIHAFLTKIPVYELADKPLKSENEILMDFASARFFDLLKPVTPYTSDSRRPSDQ